MRDDDVAGNIFIIQKQYVTMTWQACFARPYCELVFGGGCGGGSGGLRRGHVGLQRGGGGALRRIVPGR